MTERGWGADGHARWSSNQIGMTLVEMLVVLAIIGVAAGAVTLGIGAATRAPTVETEARRLATQLQSAADDAMLGDRAIAFTAAEHGYGFATMDAKGGWQPREGAGMGFHTLPGGMTMTLSARPPVLLGVDGTGQPLTADITAGDDRWVVTYDGMTAQAVHAPAAPRPTSPPAPAA
ncbi:prepilin-type N-terminal cleavage/methylation domain-containing protein [Sphingomonas sp. ac-8]|uniref:prepilin-type N-terminal cleavage/methylation domain-containing protein n=1 Tax=Sphingomonas sp. ac-8 TaxID=3242977 RepID=UPI003A7FBA8C